MQQAIFARLLKPTLHYVSILPRELASAKLEVDFSSEYDHALH